MQYTRRCPSRNSPKLLYIRLDTCEGDTRVQQIRTYEPLNSCFSPLALTACTIPPSLTGLGWGDVPGTNDEVAKVFSVLTFECIALDHGLQYREDFRLGDSICRTSQINFVRSNRTGLTSVDLVEPLTVVSTSQEHHVGARSFADESNFYERVLRPMIKSRSTEKLHTCKIWSSTTVRAPCHTHDDSVIP